MGRGVRVPADDGAIAEAAAILRRGELVVFPTETVYGVGADALEPAAVERIFRAKGRPATNPVIVHVAGPDEARALVLGFDAEAQALAAAFWPGPLTLVLPRRPEVPAIVAAGGPTLAVRAPAHPVARALLSAFGGPIAAPSANRSNAISPTRAEHAEEELADQVGIILDGGPCRVGLESTVIELGPDPRILRPGAIGRGELEAALGRPVGAPTPATAASGGALPSPGMLARHYAPRHPLVLFRRPSFPAGSPSGPVAVLLVGPAPPAPPPGPLPAGSTVRSLPADPSGYGRELYAALREADRGAISAIWVEAPPPDEAWSAIADRLRRASASPLP
jgi:L-threonylcarbamoyladenylate synthase